MPSSAPQPHASIAPEHAHLGRTPTLVNVASTAPGAARPFSMLPACSLRQQQQQHGILVPPHSKAARSSSSPTDFTIGGTCVDDDEQQQLDAMANADADAAAGTAEPFTPSMVAAGLSQLGHAAAAPAGGGCSLAFQRLEVTNTDLATPAPLAHCQQLQVLVLHHNTLATLAPLSALCHLTRLEASHNRLVQALDYSVPGGSNLRVADLSFNSIAELGPGLCQHTRLSHLTLDGNCIARLQGSSLASLGALRQLSLCGNGLRDCSGLDGLSSLRELSLDANAITSLAALSRLSGLQVLTAAHNPGLGSLEGVQGLVGLRRLGVACCRLRRIQALAVCRALPLLSDLDVAGNPLEAAQHARLHVVHLLTQLQRLNGAEVLVVDRAEAGSLVGAATDDLVSIRRQFFPHGELEDGGGAVPPTTAGLKASRAEEEAACDDPAALLETMAQWAKSVPPALALQPATGASLSGARLSASQAAASTAPPQWQHIRRTSSASSSGSSTQRSSVADAGAEGCTPCSSSAKSSCGSRGHRSCAQGSTRASASGLAMVEAPAGLPAIASRLAAGCCKEAPFRQLQLLQACWCWVLAHVQVPHGACSEEAGADAVTWDTGLPLVGSKLDEQQLLQEVLLPGFTGTWAELVVQLLVSLAKGCSLEAVHLSGYWKAGGSPPGEQLASHNHSWAAVKVNGRWRLLDPVYALVMAKQDQPVPFFCSPEAFSHSHLPFDACWQLLPVPIRPDEWWAWPQLSLAFAGAGGRLLCDVKACNELSADDVTGVLPCLRLCLALPAEPGKRLCISLWDSSSQQELASWDACSSVEQLRQPGDSVGALVFQQQVLEGSGSSPDAQQQQQQQCVPGLTVHELWAAFPHPGTFLVKVHEVTEVPGGLVSLAVAGLQQPLALALRLRHQVTRVEVIVHGPSGEADPAAATCNSSSSGHIAWLPQPQRGSFSSSSSSSQTPALQLLCPQPGAVLEADREQHFEVLVPGAAAVAVGSDAVGWAVLQPCSGSSSSSGLFAGQLMLPRAASCFVAVQWQGQHAAAGTTWEPVLALRVLPPMQNLVVFAPPQPDAAAAAAAAMGPAGSPGYAAAAAVLARLDVDGDGCASRRDMLRAFRRDRQLADTRKMPARIRAGPDGSFDAFLVRFTAINRSALGLVDAGKLCRHLETGRVGSAAKHPGTPPGQQ